MLEGGHFLSLTPPISPSRPRCPTWKEEAVIGVAAENITETFAFVPKWLAVQGYHLHHGYVTPPDGSIPR